jgi:hypothetical protein
MAWAVVADDAALAAVKAGAATVKYNWYARCDGYGPCVLMIQLSKE